MMSIVGRAARVLGPRGLMPNAKVGSVTKDVEAGVRAAKGGQAQFRAGKNGVLHLGIGKVRPLFSVVHDEFWRCHFTVARGS